jgi:hypothetical protein
VTRAPNTILGVIPLGYADAAYPLTNVASVGVNSKFSIGKLVFGLIFLFAGFGTLTKGIGILLLLIAAALLAGVFGATLRIQNNGGGFNDVGVSILEKRKLEEFREVVNQRLFADHAAMRHNQHMQVQNDQLSVQQQQLNAQIMQQNAALQAQLREQQQQPASPPPPTMGQAPDSA